MDGEAQRVEHNIASTLTAANMVVVTPKVRYDIIHYWTAYYHNCAPCTVRMPSHTPVHRHGMHSLKNCVH